LGELLLDARQRDEGSAPLRANQAAFHHQRR